MESANVFGFEDLDVWKKSRDFKKEIGILVKGFPQEEKYRLTDQLIRSSRSINSLISEGHGRFTYADQLHYCIQARGSLSESFNHLMDAFDNGYITEDKMNHFRGKLKEIERILNGYINHLRKQRDNNKNLIYFIYPIYFISPTMIYSFKDFTPVIHESSFIHPQAAVTGNVIIGKDVYVGPGAAIRGDWGGIIIEDGCNVQENCTIHMFPGVTVILKEGAHIGHGAIIHGAVIGKNCLIGMNSVIMDNVVLGDECIVGALSFIKAEEIFEARSMIVGNPAKKIKEVSDEMMQWKTEGTKLYQSLPAEMKEHWKETTPLTEIPANRPSQDSLYKTWQELRNSANK